MGKDGIDILPGGVSKEDVLLPGVRKDVTTTEKSLKNAKPADSLQTDLLSRALESAMNQPEVGVRN